MAQQSKKSSDLKKKNKKWIQIAASKDFGGVEIGETYVDEQQKAVGKVVCANLMNLTRDMKKQNIQVYFVVRDVSNNVAQTELVGYEMLPTFLKRVTKKAEERVDNSFLCKSQDGIQFRIKPVLMTKGIAHKSVQTALRQKTEEYMADAASKNSFSDIMNAVINGALQKEAKNEVKKVYPLNSFMVKALIKDSK